MSRRIRGGDHTSHWQSPMKSRYTGQPQRTEVRTAVEFRNGNICNNKLVFGKSGMFLGYFIFDEKFEFTLQTLEQEISDASGLSTLIFGCGLSLNYCPESI